MISLTTTSYPGMDMGEIAARNLINHLTGGAKVFDYHKRERDGYMLIEINLEQRCSNRHNLKQNRF
jgi:hypothetical protein